jgi:general stress protein YciG
MGFAPMKNKHAVALGRKGGKIGGAVKSPAKSAAAQANGQKGGRPRKPVDAASAAPKRTARVKRPAMPTSNVAVSHAALPDSQSQTRQHRRSV